MEKDGAEEGLDESIENSWEISDQQKSMLIRGSMGDKNFNIFEINELFNELGYWWFGFGYFLQKLCCLLI